MLWDFSSIYFADCSWQGHEAKLTLHFEDGFILVSGSSRRDIFWQQPFEKLRATADDGKHILYLEFIDSTEPYVSREYYNFLFDTRLY